VTDRSQAISLVEAALKSGRIVQADHDMRLDQIKHASSDQEVEMAVRDLVGHQHAGGPDSQWAQGAAAMGAGAAATTQTPTPTPGQPWPLVNYGPGQGQSSAELTQLTKTGGKAIGGIIGVVVLISVIVPIVGVVIGLVSAKDTFDDIDFGSPTDETTYLPGQAPGENGINVHTVDGYNAFVDAVEAEIGSTRVFDATLYPRYAVVSVPESTKGRRYTNWFWDGRTLVQQDFKSTSDDPRIDIAAVDPTTMITLLEDVRGRVEKPTSWYVSVGSVPTKGPQLSVYASNAYGEGAYVLAELDGTITYESEY
jgi:hypothetical protein